MASSGTAITSTSIGKSDEIYKIGLGLMRLTSDPVSVPDDQAFEVIKTAIDLLPSNTKLFINSGEFYGKPNDLEANLRLLKRFFEKHPELADKTFLSVKGAFDITKMTPDSSAAGLRKSVDRINTLLGGTKKMDLFEPARVDPNVPIEESMKTLKQLIEEGKFDHIGLSECKAETVERAHKIHPVAAVEIEVSPWSYEEETKKVIETTNKLGIPVIAYSPLGMGLLSGQMTLENLHEDDHRRHFSRFQQEAVEHNQKIVNALGSIAKKKGVSQAQLTLAWVSALGPHVVPLPGSGKVSRVEENQDAGKISLTADEMKEISDVLDSHTVMGARYTGGKRPEFLWG